MRPDHAWGSEAAWRPWAAVAAFVAVATFANVTTGVMGTSSSATNKTMIVSQRAVSGPCVNSGGVVVSDLAEWSTGCNKIVCHVQLTGNFTVTHGCPGYEPSQNPDSQNCQYIQHDSLPYPDCCPTLKCGVASLLTTLASSACVDLHTPRVCQIWASMTNNCTDTTAPAYNFAVAFCNSTCRLC
ncbi:uncharacterized protein LOC112574470 [Pomacea canaliculata]|uniref:uncharacterized protein LOC112574470 n=1 Tax=Pomacea canaliculata TaxID=400727 RepID=UPI000D739EE7|nr:uncharacterized protein LOC112574470 [Pomacea canaliculata]